MSWLSKAWNAIAGLPNSDTTAQAAAGATANALTKQTQVLQQQGASASAAAALALQAQTDANNIAAAAAVPQSDNEGARSASDDEQRKLLAGSNFGIGLPTQLGAPPVGFRMLSGQ